LRILLPDIHLSDCRQIHSGVHRIFYNDRELRSGWRLLIFLLIVIGLTAATNRLIGWALARGSNDVLSILRLIEGFVIVLFVSWLMGRYELRTTRSLQGSASGRRR
jgi:hypothetical protein